MNDYKHIVNKALANPERVKAGDLEDVIKEYPFVRALQWVHHYSEKQGETSIYAHQLWRGPSERVDLPKQREAILPQLSNASRVSVYHDEHLPYSFLWWLDKTRMEYAHQYKPYAPVPQAQPARESDDVLDQQIKENVFHLLEPEEKLSIQDESSDIPFQIPKKTDNIITKFIQEEPKISPPRPDKLSFENKARKSGNDQASLVTETLAAIYAEQGLYDKAIEVYEKLSLKYPEKSGYFADRIARLKRNET